MDEKTTLIDGSPVTEDHRKINSKTGMQLGYVVLSDEERAKEFVEPVRLSYQHLACGSFTTMNQAIAETYAREPKFYSGTFCKHCKAHFPVGEDGEFVWNGTDQKVGTRQLKSEVEHHCDWCSIGPRGLFAIAYNACNAYENSSPERCDRKMKELRTYLTSIQPLLDEHFKH